MSLKDIPSSSTKSEQLPLIKMEPPSPPNEIKKANLIENPNLMGVGLIAPQQQIPKTRRKEIVGVGYSMVEWMKKQSERSMFLKPLREIGLDEINVHNKENDVWLALRGKVYDVSEYVKYHPGGVSEIMKGAGIDSTALFDSVHRWVNIESILKSQLIGVLVRKNTLGSYFPIPVRSLSKLSNAPSEEEIASCSLCGICKSSSNETALVPTTSIKQDDNSITLQIDSRNYNWNKCSCTKDNWTVGILEKEKFLLKLIVKPPELWMLHLKMIEALKDEKFTLTFQNEYKKMSITFKKPEKKKWKALGSPLHESNMIMDSRGATQDFHEGRLHLKDQLTHNVYLFAFEIESPSFIGVPIGFHVKIKINEKSRRYTPITPYIGRTCDRNVNYPKVSTKDCQLLYFIIKIYSEGELTPYLNLPLESSVKIGCSGGYFSLDWLSSAVSVVMLAAGTGITPMIRIINSFVNREIKQLEKLLLLSFNQKREDVIWEDKFNELSEKEPNFSFFPVLSREEGEWSGRKGHVSYELLKDLLSEGTQGKSENRKFIICGSDDFNTTAKLSVECLGHTLDSIFIFGG